MSEFEPIDETLKHEGPVVSVYEGRFRAPDGQILVREIIRHPGAVGVVPVVDGEVVMVRQYRAAIDRHLLEIPAGKLDVDGEPPIAAAARELQEEVGLTAGELTLLAEFHNTPGFCDEYSHCYLATDCTPAPSDRQGVEEQAMTIERIALDDVPALIAAGELTDGKSIIGLMLARHHLR